MSTNRETCEVCDHDKLKDCRSCDLSSDPNPEAFTRKELIAALVFKARVDEIVKEYINSISE